MLRSVLVSDLVLCSGMAATLSLLVPQGASARLLASGPRLARRRYSSEPPLWRLGKLNHVAIAVPHLDKATELYRDVLGAKVSAPVVS